MAAPHAGTPQQRRRRADRSPGAQTVDRALDVLDCFTRSDGRPSLSELARLSGLTVPTTHRLLKALTRREFLLFDESTRRYSLGPAVLRLAGVILKREDIHGLVLPHLQRLREVSGETAALHRYLQGRRVCVLELESHFPMRMSSGMGHGYPLTAGAAGKAILAWLDADTRGDLIRADLGASAVASVERELRTIRERGYAMTFGEVVEGASAIAAPVLVEGGRPFAAVNVTGPSTRWTKEKMQKFAPVLLEATREIQRKLGADDGAPAGHVEPQGKSARSR